MVSVWSPLVTTSASPQFPYRMIYYKAWVLKLGRIVRLGTDTVISRGKYAVAAVCAATHYEIINKVFAYKYARPG